MDERPVNVLLVEDNPGDAWLIRETLSEGGDGAFSVETIDRLGPALVRLATGAFDAVLLDLTLPDSQGLATFTRMCREDPRVPIVVLTGLDDDAVAVAAVRDGAQDYVVKGTLGERPFVRVVRHAIERHRLQTELGVHLRQRAALVKLGSRALTDTEPTRLMGEASTIVADTLEVEFVAILELLPSEHALVMRAGAGWGPAQVGHALVEPLEGSLGGCAVASGEPVIVEDFSSEARFAAPRLVMDHGIVSAVSAPIRGEAMPFGVLSAFQARRRTFSGSDVSFLVSVADALAQALSRRRAEAERSRLASAIEQAADIVIVTDPAHIVLYANPAVERVTGYSRSELIGCDARLLRGPQHDEAFHRAISETLAAGRPWSGTITGQRKDGTVIEVESVISPVHDDGGNPVEYVMVARDVTRERQLEEQLREAHKMEAVGRLAGGVAHDFNNLLTAINGYAELALSELRPADPLWTDLEEVRRAAERATGLTRQLLAFSRRQVLQPEVLDLNEVVAGIAPMIRRLIGEDVTLVTAGDPQLGCIRADRGQLEQVIVNLVVNARDAMATGGTLTIETANADLDETYTRNHAEVASGPHVLMAVSDTGVGMDAATQSRLFEPFFTSKEPGRGTGLGLATVYGIVKQSGGHIVVSSEVGKGTTFKIYLPRIAEAVATAARPEPRVAARAGSETILVVEDEEPVRKFVRLVLEAQGYRVLTAASGTEALDIAAGTEGPIHLLVTDVVMPGMSGLELARRLAAARRELPVLYTSGYTETTIAHHGVLGQGLDLLPKPFTPTALARKVGEVLDARPKGRKRSLELIQVVR